MAKMRNLDRAYAEIKAKDPDTALSRYALRQIFLSGVIKTVKVGRIRLVDMDALNAFLSGYGN
jgi:hypothetical protein